MNTDAVTLALSEIVKIKGERFKVMTIEDRTTTLMLMTKAEVEREINRGRIEGSIPLNRKQRRREQALLRKGK